MKPALVDKVVQGLRFAIRDDRGESVDKAVPGLRFAIRDDRGESEASSNHTAERCAHWFEELKR